LILEKPIESSLAAMIEIMWHLSLLTKNLDLSGFVPVKLKKLEHRVLHFFIFFCFLRLIKQTLELVTIGRFFTTDNQNSITYSS